MKKTLFTILILAVLAAIGAGLFLYFKPPAAAPTTETGFQEFSPLEVGEGAPEGEVVIVGEAGEGLEEILVPGEEVAVGEEVKKINKVTDRAIAGASISYIKDGNLLIYYVDKTNGNVYKKLIDKDGILSGEERITTSIIPNVHEAFFVAKNSKIILRYAKENTIETFLGNMPTPPDTNMQGIFLEENITDLSVSPDTNKLFYLVNAGNKISGISYDLATNKKTQIFSSSFTEWLSQYPNSKSIILTAKAANGISGSSYLLDIASKNYLKIIGGISGLTTIASPSGKILLYSDDRANLNVFDLAPKTSSTVGLNTLSEKCVWSLNNTNIYCATPNNLAGNLPDDWYKGLVSFSDSLWKINLRDGSTAIIFQPEDEPFDMINLKLDERGNYLFFTNKKDDSLWLIHLRI